MKEKDVSIREELDFSQRKNESIEVNFFAL